MKKAKRTVKKQVKAAAAAVGLIGLLLAPQTALAGETRTYTGVEPLVPIGTFPASFGPSDLTSVSGNTIIIDYAGGTAPSYVFGAKSFSGASGNIVYLRNGSIGRNIYGGWTDGSGSVTGNTVTISGGSVGELVLGGYSTFSSATGNTVTVTGGAVNIRVYGGFSVNSDATNNSVTVSGGTVASALGGQSDNGAVTNNSVTISSGTVTARVIGGGTDGSGSATGNSVIISGGAVGSDVYGGFSNRGIVTGNTVIITGGTFAGDVYGGRSNSGSATGNTVTVSGSPTLTGSILYGGRTLGGDGRSGNTLNVKNVGMSARGVQNFQYYNFYLPPSLANGGTMLSVTTAANITDSTIGVGIDGSTTALHPGDKVILLHTGGLTATGINTRAVGLAGIAKVYDFDLTIDVNNLYATVAAPARTNPQVKALSEGQAAAAAFLGQGADLLSGQGLQNARGAAAGAGGQSAGFAAMGGHSLRYATGSHVDVNGFSLVLGAARQKATAAGTRLGGLFLETGWGNYSTYNQFADRPSVRGDGSTRYHGVGWLGRSQQQGGQYLEGSLRAGRMSSKFHSGDFGTNAVDYDISAPYYGLHVGVGREKNLDDKTKLDTYTKLMWNRQNGSSATVAGDRFDFAPVNSLRWQAGAKLARKVDDRTTVRAGLAYQYELNGKANSTVNGSAIDAPSLQGGTGIVELGLTQESKDGKGASLDFGLQSLFGKAKGIAGNLRASWKF